MGKKCECECEFPTYAKATVGKGGKKNESARSRSFFFPLGGISISFRAPLSAESCNWIKDLLMIKRGYQNSNFDWSGL